MHLFPAAFESISIHALREEGDGRPHHHGIYYGLISIHALREEGDITCCSRSSRHSDFYPRPPRGGRRCQEERKAHRKGISIHALREEGDITCCSRSSRHSDFYPRPPRGGRRLSCRHLLDAVQISIHALREEGDIPVIKQYFGANAFLSTPSARRATGVSCPSMVRKANFYPRPPRGGRPLFAQGLPHHTVISIHALREEGDSLPTPRCTAFADFYPRPPRGGRRHDRQLPPHHQEISIHALREEGDVVL